ncbi:hypothetical protein C1645_815083 [Glomus cerebriforme]|uniref:Methyltransferase domain-containing protein n=1 Tax=Glomus cerebriforme TaxID=658196 RepID=A0A397TP69_9GLOM|nr:hypothetical protein C1645_815083 [Glomus cerebriforme]
MGTSVSKRKKKILRRSLSRETDGFFNKFFDDMKSHDTRNSRNSKYSKHSSSINIKEPNELDSSHYVVQKLWDCDFKAPVKDILNAGNARVLDVATRKGTWVMQCAENFPWSNFTGVDVFPVFPTVTNIKLMNATFLQSNILKKLLFCDNTFDFVHMQCLTLFFTDKELENKVLKELIRVCKPGGWIELVKLDCNHLNQGPTFKKISETVIGYLSAHDMQPIIGENLSRYLTQTGQVIDIKEEIKIMPYHGNKLSKSCREQLIDNIQTYKGIFTTYMGYSYEEWDETLKILKKEVNDYKTEGIMRRIYCKKIIPIQESKSV